MPEDCTLGPLLFNIFISDIFLYIESSSISNYADDNILFIFCKNFDEVVRKLQNNFLILDKLFLNNFLVLNPEKYHFMTLETLNVLTNFKGSNVAIKRSVSEKLFDIIFHNNLFYGTLQYNM